MLYFEADFIMRSEMKKLGASWSNKYKLWYFKKLSFEKFQQLSVLRVPTNYTYCSRYVGCCLVKCINIHKKDVHYEVCDYKPFLDNKVVPETLICDLDEESYDKYQEDTEHKPNFHCSVLSRPLDPLPKRLKRMF